MKTESEKLMKGIDAARQAKQYFVDAYKKDLRVTFGGLIGKLVDYNYFTAEKALEELLKDRYFHAYCNLTGRDLKDPMLRVFKWVRDLKAEMMKEPDDILFWWMKVYKTNRRFVPSDVKNLREKAFYAKFKHIILDGGNVFNGQQHLSVSFLKKVAFKQQYQELLQVIELVEPLPLNARLGWSGNKKPFKYAGYKFISIRDKDLSQYGIWSLYEKDGLAIVERLRYSLPEEKFKGTLKQAAEFIHQNVHADEVEEEDD